MFTYNKENQTNYDVDYLEFQQGGKHKIIIELKAINIMLFCEDMTRI